MARTKPAAKAEGASAVDPGRIVEPPVPMPEGTTEEGRYDRGGSGEIAPPLVTPEPVASAVREPDVEAPPVPRYRVVHERRVMFRGFFVVLKPGKVIDPREYDVENLRGQGVVLEELR